MRWIEACKSRVGRGVIAPLLALTLAGSVVGYQVVRPAAARAAVAAPSPAPLDDNSVGALLSLDQAMETLAARVTPAIVNVTVLKASTAPSVSRVYIAM